MKPRTVKNVITDKERKQIAIVKMKNKVSTVLLEALPIVFDEHTAERICEMQTWREQILYALLETTGCRAKPGAIRASRSRVVKR